MPRYNTFFLITGVIIIGLIAGVVLLAVQASRNNSTNEASFQTLNNQATSLQSSLSSANSQMTSLTDQMNEAIAVMTSNIAANGQEITDMIDDITDVGTELTDLNVQLNSIKTNLNDLEDSSSDTSSSITSIQNQLSTITSQISSLQNTVSSLQTSITSLNTRISSLEASSSNKTSTLFTSKTITQDYDTQTLLTTFSPTGTGTLTIYGTSSSSTGYIRLQNNSLGTHKDYSFGTGATINATVTYGYNYAIYFGNTEPSGTVTASVTASYTYSSYSSIALFTSKSVTQNHGTQSTVKTYTPSYSGYFKITGTSSSATSYIRIYNNSLDDYTDYAFGTGTTITAPVIAGNNYSIIFGNTASSGTVTATLSGTYYHY